MGNRSCLPCRALHSWSFAQAVAEMAGKRLAGANCWRKEQRIPK